MTVLLHEKLKLRYPIIQAPMAGGITGPELVCAASNAGCLGSIGAGYMEPDELSSLILKVKAGTDLPFAVNLFVPENPRVSESEIKVAYDALQPFRDELGLAETQPAFRETSHYREHLDIVVRENVPVVSFTFGMPSESEVQELKNHGTYIIGTATSVMEAILLEDRGVDAIVAQGSEAGGHRATFSGPPAQHLLGIISLVPQICDFVSVPVIAAGGIMDSRGFRAALQLGAQAVQLGTAFLTTYESGAHPVYKESVLNAREDQIVVTAAFSGKEARGIKNQFIHGMENEKRILPYPLQNELTKSIRKAAAEQNHAEFMSLWCGQSPRMSRSQSVEELVQSLVHIEKETTT